MVCYCCFCRKSCSIVCKNFEVVDLIDQDRVPSKEKITCSDGIVNSFFLMCHLGFLWLQFSITYRLMSDRDAQVFDVSSIIFDDANSEHIKAKNYGAFWHGFTICVVMVVSSLVTMTTVAAKISVFFIFSIVIAGLFFCCNNYLGCVPSLLRDYWH